MKILDIPINCHHLEILYLFLENLLRLQLKLKLRYQNLKIIKLILCLNKDQYLIINY